MLRRGPGLKPIRGRLSIGDFLHPAGLILQARICHFYYLTNNLNFRRFISSLSHCHSAPMAIWWASFPFFLFASFFCRGESRLLMAVMHVYAPFLFFDCVLISYSKRFFHEGTFDRQFPLLNQSIAGIEAWRWNELIPKLRIRLHILEERCAGTDALWNEKFMPVRRDYKALSANCILCLRRSFPTRTIGEEAMNQAEPAASGNNKR